MVGAAPPISAVPLGRLSHEPFDSQAIGNAAAGMCQVVGHKERDVGIGAVRRHRDVAAIAVRIAKCKALGTEFDDKPGAKREAVRHRAALIDEVLHVGLVDCAVVHNGIVEKTP